MSGNSILEYSTGSKRTPSEIFLSSNTTSEEIEEVVGGLTTGREVFKERDN